MRKNNLFLNSIVVLSVLCAATLLTSCGGKGKGGNGGTTGVTGVTSVTGGPVAPQKLDEATSYVIESRYNLDEIVHGLKINRKIEEFSTLNPQDIIDGQNKYLTLHQKKYSFNQLDTWFYLVFPNGHEHWNKNSPYYFPSADLVSLKGSPLQIHEIQSGLAGLISKTMSYTGSNSFDTTLKYTVMKVIVNIEKLPEGPKKAQFIKDAVYILGAIGPTCLGGNYSTLTLMTNMMTKSGLFDVTDATEKQPTTLKDHVLFAMDLKREEIFQNTCSFSGKYLYSSYDVEPVHAINYCRQQYTKNGKQVHAVLKISPGYQETAIVAQSNPDVFKVIEGDEVINRFFNGKQGIVSSNDEQRRSHLGYTPKAAAVALIEHAAKNSLAIEIELNKQRTTLVSMISAKEKQNWKAIPSFQLSIARSMDPTCGTDQECLDLFNRELIHESEVDDYVDNITHLMRDLNDPKGKLNLPTSFAIRLMLVAYGVLIPE